MHINIKSKNVPKYWCLLKNISQFYNTIKQHEILLVLDACGIDRRICKIKGYSYIYIPILLEKKANLEIQEYIKENKKTFFIATDTHYPHQWLVIIPFIFLMIWYAYQTGCLGPVFYFYPPKDFTIIGRLDGIKIKLYHQWYRVITSLTLHANLAHLLGNIFLGSVFLVLSGKKIGFGLAFFLSLVGGVAGNTIAYFCHPVHANSIGFSTCVFASIGILCGINPDNKKKLFLSCAAAAGFLAMLGTEGQNTDYTAHICGLGIGFLLGMLVKPFKMRLYSNYLQLFSFIAAILVPVIGWIIALH